MRRIPNQFSHGEDSRIRDLVYKNKIDRKEAKQKDLYVYFSKKQCGCGGFIMYTSNGSCFKCRGKKRKEKLRSESVSMEKVEVRRAIENIKEQRENDYWDSLLDE